MDPSSRAGTRPKGMGGIHNTRKSLEIHASGAVPSAFIRPRGRHGYFGLHTPTLHRNSTMQRRATSQRRSARIPTDDGTSLASAGHQSSHVSSSHDTAGGKILTPQGTYGIRTAFSMLWHRGLASAPTEGGPIIRRMRQGRLATRLPSCRCTQDSG